VETSNGAGEPGGEGTKGGIRKGNLRGRGGVREEWRSKGRVCKGWNLIQIW